MKLPKQLEGKPVNYHKGHSCRNKHIYHRHSEGVFLRSIHGYCISNTSRPLESERMKSRARDRLRLKEPWQTLRLI
ncbi:uncharacterized protein L203_106231 [Cryptococcus depauperatus CBS 7841]|uniref:Uncharacterized protein n=1 Tax=Cryptococcus depauperatus CBS 7841 TaxID=1295531 RepID=A0AAJ8JYX5_9TREE